MLGTHELRVRFFERGDRVAVPATPLPAAQHAGERILFGRVPLRPRRPLGFLHRLTSLDGKTPVSGGGGGGSQGSSGSGEFASLHIASCYPLRVSDARRSAGSNRPLRTLSAAARALPRGSRDQTPRLSRSGLLGPAGAIVRRSARTAADRGTGPGRAWR